MKKLPNNVEKLLSEIQAPTRLITHLEIVYITAQKIVDEINAAWPMLHYDRQAVLIGAATHDIGKVIYPNELTGPGHEHERVGPELLIQYGIPPHQARFARTHGSWKREMDIQLEDLLVTFADKIWKGARDDELELALAQQIASRGSIEFWESYQNIDKMASKLSEGAHERILWQGM